MSVEQFWKMTPREVALTIRVEGERRFDRLDDLVYAAWHGALWSHADISIKRMPELREAYVIRKKRPQPASMAQEVARWMRWAKAGKWREGN